jgi:hypothetical protein
METEGILKEDHQRSECVFFVSSIHVVGGCSKPYSQNSSWRSRNMMADSGRIHSGPILKIVVEWDSVVVHAPSILTHALLGKLISGQTNFIGLLKLLGLCPQKKCLNRPAAAGISLKLENRMVQVPTATDRSNDATGILPSSSFRLLHSSLCPVLHPHNIHILSRPPSS